MAGAPWRGKCTCHPGLHSSHTQSTARARIQGLVQALRNSSPFLKFRLICIQFAVCSGVSRVQTCQHHEQYLVSILIRNTLNGRYKTAEILAALRRNPIRARTAATRYLGHGDQVDHPSTFTPGPHWLREALLQHCTRPQVLLHCCARRNAPLNCTRVQRMANPEAAYLNKSRGACALHSCLQRSARLVVQKSNA